MGHFLFVRRGWHVAVVLGLALGVFLVQVGSAGADAPTKQGKLHGKPKARQSTQLVITGWGPGPGVNGFIANIGSSFDPTTTAYPSYSTAPPGFSDQNEGFAGLIYAEPPGGGTKESLYCIDIRTLTTTGYGYVLGTWDEANVPNVGYVARILEDYYPNTSEPSDLSNASDKAAAVQAAIWYFSDKFVLSSTANVPLHTAVAAIVTAVQAKGPVPAPKPPTLTITPSTASGAASKPVGPFKVSTDHPPATVTADGATMYSDAAGTAQIPNGDTVPDGQNIWLRSTGPSDATLEASSTATVPSGNVYLSDRGADQAQKLILAATGTLTANVQATAQFLPAGSLKVTKTIAGPAAGSRGPVVIQVACDDGVTRPDFTIDATAPAGPTSKTYDGIPAGTKCTVTETVDGSNKTTTVIVSGDDGKQVTIQSGKTASADITDTYDYAPGSLIVMKTIAGPGAGQQGAITIHTVCTPAASTPDFVIPAGAAAGDYTMRYDGLAANSSCTVTETADGHTSAVSVVVVGSGQTKTIPAGDVAEADISDTYGLVPGQLEVTKTIAGAQAGQQGSVTIHTVCTPAPAAGTPDFVIPAGATGDQSLIYSGIPAGASCVVTETADGHSSAVSVVTVGSPQTTTIPAGGAGAAHITDTYGAVPGSLLVTKSITGPFAGKEGPVTVHVVCNGTALSPDFVIPAATPAGSVSHSFDGIPAGSVCTVSETADGSTDTVTAAVTGGDQTVTVPAGQVVPVSLVDVYEAAPGSLIVTKKFTGSGAHAHGPVAILVACGGPVDTFAFTIRAHTGGSVSRRFDGLPAGSRCTVTEVAVGRTARVTVVAIGKRQTVTISANGVATVHLTDRFSVKAIAVTRPPAVTG